MLADFGYGKVLSFIYCISSLCQRVATMPFCCTQKMVDTQNTPAILVVNGWYVNDWLVKMSFVLENHYGHCLFSLSHL